MKYLLTGIAGLAALGLVALTPDTASAKRYYGWGGFGPGVGIYVGPRYGYRNYGYRNYGYRGGPRAYRYSYGYGPRWKHRYRYW